MDGTFVIGLFFLLIGIATIIKVILTKKCIDLFWFCDFAPFLFAVGFFIQNAQFIKSIINIGLLGQVITFIGLLSYRGSELHTPVKGHNRLRKKFFGVVELLIHLTAVIALIFTFRIAPTLDSLVYSLFIIACMFIATFLFTPPALNINALYSTEINYGKGAARFKLPFHLPLWIVYTFLVSVLAFLLQYALYAYGG